MSMPLVIQEMLAKSDEKMKAAQVLLDNAIYDDSASRSYYAVFHAISAVLFSKNLVFSSHKETIGSFNKEFIKTSIFVKNTSLMIEKLFRSRQSGDYDIKVCIDKETACERLDYARQILSSCREYLDNIYQD